MDIGHMLHGLIHSDSLVVWFVLFLVGTIIICGFEEMEHRDDDDDDYDDRW